MESKGKVITVCGLVAPETFGTVLMHEHLHSDVYDWGREELVFEKPMTEERREYLMREEVPYLKKCAEYGCFGVIEATAPPWRAWPDYYVQVSEITGINIVICSGCYCEVKVGDYWVKKPEHSIWPFVKKASVEELADHFIKEITDGIHGTKVRAGAIKLGTWKAEATDMDKKVFRAGARAQKATGVHITTHCCQAGAVTNQLEMLDKEGVDLSRVVIGHAWYLGEPEGFKICVEWMKRGANFLPTNLGIDPEKPDAWKPLVEAIHRILDLGLEARIAGLSLDSGFGSAEKEPFTRFKFVPPPPFLHMFTHTLPNFRGLGLTTEEEALVMRHNPQLILPVQ